MLTYLALGDSYTIGEQVPYEANFPNVLVQQLNALGMPCAAPVIIATTGWTTDELAAAIRERALQEQFSFVSLLIGVNNQYRGRLASEYAVEFESLLQQAIAFAKGKANHVFVLSIPDWGVTPFAKDRNAELIAAEIDDYNAVNKQITQQYGCAYLDITPSTRKNGTNADYLAEDGLHPSALEYAIWASALNEQVKHHLQ
jgi:lysophospholipase L1-like esterase